MFITKEETKTHNIYKIGKFKLCFRKSKANNNIFVVDENGNKKRVKKIKGLKIKFKGANSTVTIHKPMLNFIECEAFCGDNVNIEIKSSKHSAKAIKIYAERENTTAIIGKNFSCQNYCSFLLNKEPNKTISIGDNCMFGGNIVLRTTDSHPIYDLTTNELINKGGDIIIGNNVWIAKNVTILKNTKIADGCIIGTESIVTKDCEKNNSVYVGNPAKLIKENIRWDREFKE